MAGRAATATVTTAAMAAKASAQQRRQSSKNLNSKWAEKTATRSAIATTATATLGGKDIDKASNGANSNGNR